MSEKIKGDIILDKLAEAWNEYLKEFAGPGAHHIPENKDDTNDFRKAIHDAQRIIFGIQIKRQRPEKF